MRVALFDTSAPPAPLQDELRAAIARVLRSERYILGDELSAFEREFAAYCGVDHAVGLANGTEAITIALRAMGVAPGDEVVVPSFTFYASAEAIPATGARPVFCDIDPETFCVTAETVRAALTPKTKAVIGVHLFGNVAPVAEIEALGAPVLEDAAQAAGSTSIGGRPGALGTAATFSFYPSKNLGCFWHLYVVAHPEVERLEGVLATAGVGNKPYYRTPVHRQAAMREWGAGVELPGTEQAARSHLAIPMSPVLSAAQAEEVVAAVWRL